MAGGLRWRALAFFSLAASGAAGTARAHNATARRSLYAPARTSSTPPRAPTRDEGAFHSCVPNKHCFAHAQSCGVAGCERGSEACNCLRRWMRQALNVRPHFLEAFCKRLSREQCERKIDSISRCEARTPNNMRLICVTHATELLPEPPPDAGKRRPSPQGIVWHHDGHHRR